MTKGTRTARERAVELLRATLATTTWLPDTQAKRLVWAIRGTLVVGLLLLVAAVVEKGLWDWLDLLIIPAVLAAGGLWFNRQQRERELEIAREQRERDVEIADQRAQDEALQAYLDQVGQLLLDEGNPLRQSEEGAEVRILARARTLALRTLDGDHKRSLLLFLNEAQLIQAPEGKSPIVRLEGIDLRGLVLKEVDHLSDVNLSDVDLSGAALSGAFLVRADLSSTNLSGANLSGAFLAVANLRGANLGGANLNNAHLGGALGVTEEQLDQAASLEGAIMPNGQKYEDWRKDREGRKGDAENG